MEYELLLVNVMRNCRQVSYGFQDCIGQHLIAEYLRIHDFKAKVFSEDVQNALPIIQNEISSKGVPVVGFYTAADNIVPTCNMIRRLKKLFPSIIAIVGGPQAIALKKEFFLQSGLDYAIVGEGEIPVLKLMSYLIDDIGTINEIPSLVYLDDNGNLVRNSTVGAAIEDLDIIPYPKYENSLNKTFRQDYMVGIITGRGCPFRCAFCYEGSNAKNIRFRSVSNVIEEIDYIIERNPKLKYINVYDDTFTLDYSRLAEFCKEIKKRNLGWFCEGHGYYLAKHLDVIPMMVDAGLVSIQLGIESGSHDVLNAYNKKTMPEDILAVVSELKKSGISSVSGNFIIGGAKETPRTIEETKKFAVQLLEAGRGIIEISVVYFAPYPNTDMVTNPDKYGVKLCPEMEQYVITTMKTPVIETQTMTKEDIRDCKKEFDAFLAEQYRLQAYNVSKSDLLQGLFCHGKREVLNQTWEKAYKDIDHIRTFMEHLTDSEQTYSDERYPLRTFESFTVSDGIIHSDAGEFCGKEAKYLLNANGRNTAKELAYILGMDYSEAKAMFENLNNRCLVYLSEF